MRNLIVVGERCADLGLGPEFGIARFLSLDSESRQAFIAGNGMILACCELETFKVCSRASCLHCACIRDAVVGEGMSVQQPTRPTIASVRRLLGCLTCMSVLQRLEWLCSP
jgi:hypothetical protein